MTWEMRLIKTYFTVCRFSDLILYHGERMSNHKNPSFTDEEVMTVYLFCTMDDLKLHTKREIYNYADRHLRSWFPELPGYVAFVGRLNRLNNVFGVLSDHIAVLINEQRPELYAGTREFIVDSLPVMLAKNQRAKTAKVALNIANSGYCATKDTVYHGFKFHASGLMAADSILPFLHNAALTPASVHDNTGFKEELARNSINAVIYADSAYVDRAGAPELSEKYNVTVCPIQKRKKGQKELFYYQKCQNTAVSRIRQPIEGYFGWLIERTDIQNASKCRSEKGALLHIFGKIAASLVFLLIFNS